MNFLAHCGLAHDAALTWQCSTEQRRGLLAGAVIGDFVKGPIPADWPTPLRAGARLHRKIDALSNINTHIKQNCDRYPTHLRRLAPIFVDMLADHCLSLSWSAYYRVEVAEFSTECYHAIDEYADFLNPQAARFVRYMHDVDLLANYDDWEHVARGLKSVLRRLRREDWFADVQQASLELVPDSQTDFAAFYPELQNAWREWDAFSVIAAPQS